MPQRKISQQTGQAAVHAWLSSAEAEWPRPGASGGPGSPDNPQGSPGTEHDDAAPPDRRTLATAVRYLLEELAERAPGNSVEVRVPPFGVTQCVEGPRHTRGTPPNVVEISPKVWLELATGRTTWASANHAGRISSSGTRADISAHLPLV